MTRDLRLNGKADKGTLQQVGLAATGCPEKAPWRGGTVPALAFPKTVG